MAVVALHIEDPVQRLTVKALLEAAGHSVGAADASAVIVDTPEQGVSLSAEAPILILTTHAGIPDAVEAMRRGAFGYVLVPLQPGEVVIKVQRALEWSGQGRSAEVAARLESRTLRLEEVEREHILAAIRRCRGNHTQAARELGIGRNTLWRKLRQYGGERGTPAG